MSHRIELIEEFRLSSEQHRQIRQLLTKSFPQGEYETRNYYKQLPQRRVLCWNDDQLVGQMGVEHRVIGLSNGAAQIFGVIDLCVHSEFHGAGIATKMLKFLEDLACQHKIEFIILFAQDDRLYARNGFRRETNRLRWVKIHDHTTLGIGEDDVDELMVKRIQSREWTSGLVDLLGYLF